MDLSGLFPTARACRWPVANRSLVRGPMRISGRPRLPEKQRPAVCQALEPRDVGEGGCVGHLTKHDLAMAWIPFQEEIVEALALVRRKPELDR